MTISRYKIMAGILGVSLGGLAVAGQCSRPDTPHRAGDAPPADPKVPNAGSKPALLPAVPPPALPTPASLPIPSVVAADLPMLPAPMSAPQSKLPELPTPVKVELPRPASVPTPVVIPASGTTLPDLPPMIPAAPKAAAPTAPPTPPVTVEPTAPTTSLIPTPPAPSAVVPTPPSAVPPTPSIDPAPATRPAPAAAVQQVAATANRFRILLRVGEGEPMFEVKSGDDLVLRVVCEKVDVKSPEKGSGPSSVVASGRVRFVGFGAEGTCDSLSFQAGSGEVSMTGAVRVQVKDRIGRVESELTSDRLQYRLDANALPGTLRP
ncbi:MAG TPA: hypothetical protein VD866_02930 [Urbifossiella sp.]|nr:hypothetical protein [Urbifossiella sp.]